MRKLIASEKGDQDPWDLKLVAGGLIDVEFVAQYLVLAHAHDHPGLLDVSTRAVIAAAGAGGLLTLDEAETLADAHRLYTDATQIMRLAVAGPFDPLKAASGVKRRIAAAAALPDFESLQGAVRDARDAVRRVYAKALGGHAT
jgi:glutamate-ammonia-ligase adenylyltransferase